MKKKMTIALMFLLVLFVVQMNREAPNEPISKLEVSTGSFEKSGYKHSKRRENFEDAEAPMERDARSDTKGSSSPNESRVTVIKVNPRSLRESQEGGKSSFSKSYKLMTEVELTNKGGFFSVEFDEPVNQVLSLVIIGGAGEGESAVSKVSVNGKDVDERRNSLGARYFENDWKKLELYGNKFKSLSFFGKAIGQDTTIKVYLQYQGEHK